MSVIHNIKDLIIDKSEGRLENTPPHQSEIYVRDTHRV